MYIDFLIIYFLLYCLIYLQRVHMVSLEKTVLRNVIQYVKTVTFLMVCVILDAIRAGRETFVTKVIIMFKYTFYFFFWIYMKNEFKKHRPLYYRTFSKLSTWLFWGRKPIQKLVRVIGIYTSSVLVLSTHPSVHWKVLGI